MKESDAFFIKMNKKESPKQVEGDRIILRYPKMEDAAEFIEKSISSVRFHNGLVNPPLDLQGFETFVKRNDSESNECFLICEKQSKTIIGTMNVSQIFHMSFQNAYLGYYAFADYSRNGFMTDAVKTTLKFAFQELNLHRLEANIQPQNLSSINLVKRCGFTKEGFSRKYLKIGGEWKDHERWAIIKEDWRKIYE